MAKFCFEDSAIISTCSGLLAPASVLGRISERRKTLARSLLLSPTTFSFSSTVIYEHAAAVQILIFFELRPVAMRPR